MCVAIVFFIFSNEWEQKCNDACVPMERCCNDPNCEKHLMFMKDSKSLVIRL